MWNTPNKQQLSEIPKLYANEHIPLQEAANKQRLIPVDSPLIQAARHIGTCFGDQG